MEIYQFFDWWLVFLVKNFFVGQWVFVDSFFGQFIIQGEVCREEVMCQGELFFVKEVLLVVLGSCQSRFYLLVYVDQELFIYEVFFYDFQFGQGNFKVCFKKVFYNINFCEKKLKLFKKKVEGGSMEEGFGVWGCVVCFCYFEDIYGYLGVFICGFFFYWLLVIG